MVESIADLVFRIADHRTPLPRAVSRDQFTALVCNRCGACCDDIPAQWAPHELVVRAGDPAIDPEQRRFLGGLVAVGRSAGGWRYACRHFRRDADGLGVCDIYEARPAVCRWFPGGNVVRSWSQCAWYVEIRDTDSDQVLSLDGAAGEAAATDA